MATVLFDFKSVSADQWTMQNACTNPSFNPAPVTGNVIYIIHNQHTNSTYVGFAANANHRWKTRVESFHCMGIAPVYGAGVLCASCIPHQVVGGVATPYPGPFAGANNPEHLLIRAVVNGLLGVTTNVNTALSTAPYVNGACTAVQVHVPMAWPNLLKDRYVAIGGPY